VAHAILEKKKTCFSDPIIGLLGEKTDTILKKTSLDWLFYKDWAFGGKTGRLGIIRLAGLTETYR